ncbi:histidine kinase [Dechloromonas sp. ZY10]|uniref:sensor histidine kinase n=1 Tax=Dechloromonas aquae TaxID=2664436 RepID=UPI003528D4E4
MSSEPASIRHFPAAHPLPDWRNLGVLLRTLLGINAAALLWALAQVGSGAGGSSAGAAQPWLTAWAARYLELAVGVEPHLFLLGLLLALARDGLWRLPLRLAQGLVTLLAGGLALGLSALGAALGIGDGGLAPVFLLAMAAWALLLGYFDLRARAHSPVLAEARLAALNARIRPHFLFNSLNAVLSLIRARPQQAENALESLADLFRAALRDPGELVRLGDEIELGRQYLELEKLRLGERLTVEWQIGDISPATPIPPLMLQPLLENAVYHGIEPSPAGGCIRIAIGYSHPGDRREFRLSIGNPLPPVAGGRATHAAGNRIALDNIRERLRLYYDLEARLKIESQPEYYQVNIVLPCPPPCP